MATFQDGVRNDAGTEVRLAMTLLYQQPYWL